MFAKQKTGNTTQIQKLDIKIERIHELLCKLV